VAVILIDRVRHAHHFLLPRDGAIEVLYLPPSATKLAFVEWERRLPGALHVSLQ
jgi:hypothetical protein